ncbi:MAG: hypothetical protein ACLUNQ_04245 [Oscillospiraceae bacterium]
MTGGSEKLCLLCNTGSGSLPGPISPRPCKCALLARFGSAEEVYYADPRALSAVEPLGKEQLDSLSDKSLDKALAILDRCARKDVFVLTLHDALYPQRLRNIF